LSRPAIPKVPGLEHFAGESFHAADWHEGIRVEGKAVAVVGAGATAIQVVPHVAEHARHAYVFVRTPSYVMPRPDLFFDRPDRESPTFAARQQERREGWFRQFEKIAENRFPMDSERVAEPEKMWRDFFDTQVKDPALREILTPQYRFGCKRPLFSNAYYPAMNSGNVTAIGKGVSRLDRHGIVDSDGEVYPVDMIVWATGYDVANMLGGIDIVGRRGTSLSKAWNPVPEAFFGTLVKGFPNLFLINGPNVGGASATEFIEGQSDLIIHAIQSMSRNGARTVEVSAEVHDAFNADVQRRASNSVLVLGNCTSWYRVGGDGSVFTHWPGTIAAFRREIVQTARNGLSYGGLGVRAEAGT
jgi:cation diffusion facilitator CzcD-associated flavoprotein CzcO